MSIEAKIDALIAALNANTAALTGAAPAPTAKAPLKDKTPPAQTAASKPAPAQPAANDTPVALTYEKDVKLPMMHLAKTKSRGAVEAIFNKSFGGIKKATELKPEQWPAFIAAVAAAQADASIPLVTAA